MNYFYKKLIKHLSKPMAFYSRPWLLITLNIALSALILIFYEPFGYHFDSWSEFTQLIGFSVIAFFYSTLFFLSFPQLNRMKAHIRHWNIGKNLAYSCLFLFITGISISFYDFHLIQQHTPADYTERIFCITMLKDTIAVFTIGVVPLCVGIMLEKMHHMKQHIDYIHAQQESRAATHSVSAAPENDMEEMIELTGQTKETLTVHPNDIIYLESAGNYVDIHLRQAHPAYKTIRSTLKDMELQLTEHKEFIRCHRAYIVNIHFFTKIEKNTQGYYLKSLNNEEDVPVSRTYLKQIKTNLLL